MSKRIRNNAGTTLIELMVYMIIGLIVIAGVYKIITTAATTYVQGRAVSKGQFNARDVINSITKDIASMGFKIYNNYATGDPDIPVERLADEFGATRDSVVVGIDLTGIGLGDNADLQRWQLPGNKSAFFFTNDDVSPTGNDELEFFRIRTGDVTDGGGMDREDVMIARERIIYRLSDPERDIIPTEENQLIREIWTWRPDNALEAGGTRWGNPVQTIILSDVMALNFRFSRRGEDGNTNADSWTSDIAVAAADADNGAIFRDRVRHIEVAILVRSHRRGKTKGREQYAVGERNIVTNPEFIHRLYTQQIEVPSNGIGLDD